MDQTMQQTDRRSVASSPVDDATYNLLQALTSKLEALEVYEQYQQEDDTGTFSRLLEEDREHATMLLEALRDRLMRS
jgi:hypothetical protein